MKLQHLRNQKYVGLVIIWIGREFIHILLISRVKIKKIKNQVLCILAKLAGAVEYTDWISAEG